MEMIVKRMEGATKLEYGPETDTIWQNGTSVMKNVLRETPHIAASAHGQTRDMHQPRWGILPPCTGDLLPNNVE